MGFLSDSRDRFIETMALPILNRSFLAPYGHARELRINSSKRTAEILVDLKGEPEPLRLVIEKYEFSQRDNSTYVTIHGVETSREWLTTLAQRFLIGKPLEVPPEVAGMLTRVM
jgi:hypothetical protein